MLSRSSRRPPTDEHRLKRRSRRHPCNRHTGHLACSLWPHPAALEWRRQCQLVADSSERGPAREGPLPDPLLTLPRLASHVGSRPKAGIGPTIKDGATTPDSAPRESYFRITELSSESGPRAWDDAVGPGPELNLFSQPEPDYKFSQRIAWQPPFRDTHVPPRALTPPSPAGRGRSASRSRPRRTAARYPGFVCRR